MGGRGFMVAGQRFSSHTLVSITETTDTKPFLSSHMPAPKSELFLGLSNWGQG